MGVCQSLVDYGVVGLAGEVGGLERVISRGCLPTSSYTMDRSCPLPVRVHSPGAVRSSTWGCLFLGALFLAFCVFCLPSVCLPLLVAAGLRVVMLLPSGPLAVPAAVGVRDPICGVFCG